MLFNFRHNAITEMEMQRGLNEIFEVFWLLPLPPPLLA